MLIKLGEAVALRPEDLQPLDKLSGDLDLNIESRMRKFAENLKVIAPQAKDFLYFTCVMMHAAEAACLNDDGTPKKKSNGEIVTSSWEKVGNEGVRWVCNEPSIQPYRNNNRDIFPESELKVAYKNWVGRPLCLDHQSQSVDKIRGVIVDTVYDDTRKRVIALCALDSKNYPDLADKVRSGVATNVSMGTAVGKAVCSDCHTVARTERDFCQHMRAKSCYGEINMDLAPIELSLVVQGADPRAKVKHIIASDIEKAAGLLGDYLNMKESAKDVSTQDLESIKKDLTTLSSKMAELMGEVNNKTEDKSEAVGPTRSGNWAGIDNEVDHNVTQVNAPEAFPLYASELQKAVLGAQRKIASLQENLSRLSNEEPTMTKEKINKEGYYQGTEEPKPAGTQQYQVDPANEQGRLADKNLHGPAPFPNTGDIEGIYPGDAEKKKELQRLAEAHERAMFREAALKKAKEQLQSKGYMQGTEDPKPGQVTYTPDPLNDKAREEDKSLVGAPPFPGVGDIEGLYGDDMKVKEMLSRASLKARFEKAAAPDGRVDKSQSAWVVYANETPILKATVDQITRGRSSDLYDGVATKAFGSKILERIKGEGLKTTAEKLTGVVKQAQEAAPAAPAPVEPVPEPMDDLAPPEDVAPTAGDPGEIVEDIEALVDELETKLNDLRDKVSGPVEEDAAAMEDIAPAGDEEFAPPAAPAPAAPKSATQLQGMRKRVNGMLQSGIKETVSKIASHVKELKIASNIYKGSYASMNNKQRQALHELTIDAVKDARAVLDDTNKLIKAVVKYAHGASELDKRASLQKNAQPAEIQNKVEKILDEMEDKSDYGVDDEEEGFGFFVEPEDMLDDEVEKDFESDFENYLKDERPSSDFEDEDDDDVMLPAEAVTVENGETMVDTDKLTTAADRAEARVKLAQKALLGFNDLSDQAHPGGSADVESAANLDQKVNAPGAKFHVYKDLKDSMMQLANMPPRVRKQAEMIQELVSNGSIKAEDVDQLVKHNVDADAVAYWKAMWGEAKDPQASEFAGKLTQEHAKNKNAEAMNEYKAKVKRAYEFANQMVSKGFIVEAQVDSQVEDIMKWNDASFDSMKKILATQPATKQASVPDVGINDGLSLGHVLIPGMTKEASSPVSDIQGFFDSYFNDLDRKRGLKV